MARQPNPTDVLHLGTQIATVKANMPKKRWAKFLKYAHARGHTISGELSSEPSALKERTASSLRTEAQNSVTKAYAPAQKELTTRQAAIGFLDDKRKTDDAAYRTWLEGETNKLNASAAAADATLASQQQGIATETATAIKAARADSLKRMAGNAGNVSDPAQSAALDTSAADTAATQHIQAARDQTAALTAIGGDARTLAAASVLAQQGARAASNDAATWKALGDVSTDRNTLNQNEAAAKLDKLGQLQDRNVSVVQGNRDAALAGASLDVKQQDIAQQVTAANQKYRIAKAQYGLSKWKAENANTVAQEKVKLGYDKISSTEGIAAADRKLNERLAKIRAAGKTKGGVSTDERNLYKDVESARGRIQRWTAGGMTPDQITAKLRGLGADDVTISVARDLFANNGALTPAGAAAARKLGIKHVGYFWAHPQPQSNLGQTNHQ